MIDKKNVANLYPLTALQEGILYHVLHDRASRAYFERLEFGLDGPLDAQAYRLAWQDLCDRHDILRTVFLVRNTPRPLQVVLKRWPVSLHEADLSALPAAEARAQITQWKADDLDRGFALTDAVPMRLALFKTGPSHHRVVWSFSHILLDGWCLDILQNEFNACYLARLDGQAARLPPVPRFASYVRWLESRDRAQEQAFWRDLLEGFTQPSPVPRRLGARFDAQSLPTDALRRAEHIEALVPAAQAQLDTTARQLGVSSASVLQALWGVLLAASHGARDAVFAATVAGRPAELAGSAAMVGLFINAVPVRVRFDGADSLADIVRRVHEQGITARAHHATPLPEVQAAHPLRAQLLDHVLVFENYPQDEAPADARLPRPVMDDADLHEYTHYGFEFQFLPGTPAGGAARLRFRFDTRLHAPASMAQLAQQLCELLQCVPGMSADQALERCLSTWRGPRRVALAASFTLEPVAQAMGDWLRQFAQPAMLACADYNQCARALLDPQGPLANAELAFLLYHPENGLRDADPDSLASPAQLPARLQAAHQAVHEAFERWCARADMPPLVVTLLPALHQHQLDAQAPNAAATVMQLAQQWADRVLRAAAAGARISVLDLRDGAAALTATGLPLAEWPDAAAWRLGHLPYTEAACAALGAGLARRVLCRARAPMKVIAVDCDNTLWDGVCAELGPLGVQFAEGHLALQRFLLARQQEGFMLVLASKNAADDVWAVFDQNPQMLLQREHLAGAAINWQSKSSNLQALAIELNVGLDSFIFIDDNPTEIAEVTHHCPQLLALPLPADIARVPDWLALCWAFDQVSVTTEDRERTRMMQAEAARKQLQAGADELDAFLRGIGLRLLIGPMAAHQLARVAQLTQRTNQFNLSGLRRSEVELAALAREPHTQVLAVEVNDRFGDYGLTGVVIVRQGPGADAATGILHIDTLLLSCRVLGRRVEQGILHALARNAQAQGLTLIEAVLMPTARNEPAALFLRGAPWQTHSSNHFVCAVPSALTPVDGLEVCADHVFLPPAGPNTNHATTTGESVLAAAADTPSTASQTTLATAGPVSPLPLPLPLPLDVDADLGHARQYLPWLAAARGWPRHLPAGLDAARLQPVIDAQALATAASDGTQAPLQGLTAQVAAIWAEVLQLPQVPLNLGFETLGGHSLHAVRVVSRIERAFTVRLDLAEFFALGTVQALVDWLEQRGAAQSPAPRLSPGAKAAAALHAAVPYRVADAPDYPLSPSQQRLWVLSELGQAGAAYNLCAAWRLRGPLDVAALERALQQLVQRHEALRTVFVATPDGPRQRVLDTQALVLETQGLKTHRAPLDDSQPSEVLTKALAAMAAQARAPFDLARGPLLRASLVRLDTDDHLLALAMHHIVSDGQSFGLMLSDLRQAYAQQPPTPPPGLRYRDYAVWTRSDAFTQQVAAHRAYWLARIGAGQDLPPTAQIPSDRPRPASPSGRGARLRLRLPLDPAQRTQLAQCLAGSRASLYQLLSSLVMLLIARHGEQALAQNADTDANQGLAVRIGSPVSGRHLAEFESTVGMFVNTVVLDARVRLQAPFTQLLAEVRSTALAALQHQLYPFDQLVQSVLRTRDTSRNPLFDVLVVLQNAPRGSDGLAGLSAEGLDLSLDVAAFELVFEFAQDDDDALLLDLSYATDLWDAPSIERLGARFVRLWQAALAQPDSAPAGWPLAGPAEQGLLASWRAGPPRALSALTLAQRFVASAAQHAQRTALVTAQGALDYAALHARATRQAWALQEHGVRPGDRVAVLLDREASWPVALLGTLLAGAVYLPLEPRHPPARLATILDDAQPRVLLGEAARHPDLTPPVGCTWLAPVAEYAGPGAELRDPSGDAMAGATAQAQAHADAPAYLIYTSGSTGTPKGVEVSHRAFLNMIDAQIEGFGLQADDRALQLASCAFDASLSEMFLAWLSGAALVLADADTVGDAARLGRLLAEQRVSIATFTPSYLRYLDDQDLGSLRRVVLAGEAVYGRDVARLLARGIDVFNAYGPTETAVCATLGRITSASTDASLVPIGRPLANLVIAIRDPRGQAVPVGVAGELLVFGPGVALGYWRRPELNAERFVQDVELGRGYRTGDCARWLGDGRIEFLGRLDDLVKLRGLRIEPGEITACLLAQPGVSQAAVTVEAGPAGVDMLVAWVQGAASGLAALKTALQLRLPAYMVPERWHAVQALPLTPSGKLDRQALRSLAPSKVQDVVETQAPASALEQALLAVWREVLGEQIGLTSDFFGSGGNSLLAMQTARRISARLERDCPALMVFSHSTVRALAAALSTAASAIDTPTGGAAATGLVWHQWGDPTTPLLLALPPAPGLGAVYAQLAARLQGVDLRAPDLSPAPLDAQLQDWAALALALDKPVVLLGASAGGRLALALAAVMTQRGHAPLGVVLADCWRWDEQDASLQGTLRLLDAQAQADDQALLQATGLPWDAAAQARSQRYRAVLRGLRAEQPLPVPICHLLADTGTQQVPDGFGRDWSDCSALALVLDRLDGGHAGLLAGPGLAANAARLQAHLQAFFVRVEPGSTQAFSSPSLSMEFI